MRFSDDLRRATGFLCVQRTNEAGRVAWIPDASFFLLEHEETIWMVTAKHAVEDGETRRARMFAKNGDPHEWLPKPDEKTGEPGWELAAGEGVDIAVREYDGGTFPGLATVPSGIRFSDLPRDRWDLGQPTFFVGMLSWLADANRRAMPVVRSANVAAFDQVRIPRSKPVGSRWDRVHLIDTRSSEGFSGGPAFTQYYLTGPRQDPWPPAWKRLDHVDGEVATVTHWFGMFVGYGDAYGIGAVVPESEILELVEEASHGQRTAG